MTEQQPLQKQNVRVVFYITPEWATRLDEVVQADGGRRGPWMRRLMERTIIEMDTPEMELSDEERSAVVQLAAARAQIQGFEALVEQMRERQGLSDAHNQDLNRQLESALSTVDRVTLMLPAAGQTGRRWWKLW